MIRYKIHVCAMSSLYNMHAHVCICMHMYVPCLPTPQLQHASSLALGPVRFSRTPSLQYATIIDPQTLVRCRTLGRCAGGPTQGQRSAAKHITSVTLPLTKGVLAPTSESLNERSPRTPDPALHTLTCNAQVVATLWVDALGRDKGDVLTALSPSHMSPDMASDDWTETSVGVSPVPQTTDRMPIPCP